MSTSKLFCRKLVKLKRANDFQITKIYVGNIDPLAKIYLFAEMTRISFELRYTTVLSLFYNNETYKSSVW